MTVVAIPGIGISIGVGARLSGGGSLIRSLAVVAVSVRSVVATIVTSVSTIAVVAIPRVSGSIGVRAGCRGVIWLGSARARAREAATKRSDFMIVLLPTRLLRDSHVL